MSEHQPPQPDRVTARSTAAAPRPRRQWLALRMPIPMWQAVLCGVACIATCYGIWYWLTAGDKAHERIIAPGVLPSPTETFAQLHSLWFDSALSSNTAISLWRVVLGFSLAAVVGVPLGVLCGCFTPIGAFFAPLMIFGRNIPIAALIPLTFAFFGLQELQKVMFVFIACVAFIVGDTARAVSDVSERYVDTAYTLGANRWQIICKVLFPLALPSVFNSLRLLFGLAFGYIMLTEQIKVGDEVAGIGNLIAVFDRYSMRANIILILLIIPIVALAVDRVLYFLQRQLFPHQYGGSGHLRRLARLGVHVWEDLKSLVVPRKAYAEIAAQSTSHTPPSAGAPQ